MVFPWLEKLLQLFKVFKVFQVLWEPWETLPSKYIVFFNFCILSIVKVHIVSQTLQKWLFFPLTIVYFPTGLSTDCVTICLKAGSNSNCYSPVNYFSGQRLFGLNKLHWLVDSWSNLERSDIANQSDVMWLLKLCKGCELHIFVLELQSRDYGRQLVMFGRHIGYILTPMSAFLQIFNFVCNDAII